MYNFIATAYSSSCSELTDCVWSPQQIQLIYIHVGLSNCVAKLCSPAQSPHLEQHQMELYFEFAKLFSLRISGIHTVEGLAVDWMGGNLYWTDDGPKKTINVARLEKASQTRKTLIEGKMSHPRAIVLDPVNG